MTQIKTLIRDGWLIALVMLAFVFASRCAPEPVYAALPKPIPKACSVTDFEQYDQYERLVGSGWNVIEGKFWKEFDLNGNHRVDYLVVYEIRGIAEDKTFRMSPFPVRFYFDTDDDGAFDKAYYDVNGNGRCDDLVPLDDKDPHVGRR